MIENILDENENAVEIATSEAQETEISNQVIQEYIDSIRSQAESTIRKPYEDDYVELFTTGFLRIPVEEFYDSAYVTDDKVNRNDIEYVKMFLDAMNYTFDINFGVRIVEGANSGMLYSMYKIFITHFADFFLNYVCGLQKLGPEFEEDIPNWAELSFEHYKKIAGDKSPTISYALVKSYIDYIIEDGLFGEYYFEICQLESSGNNDLSDLVVASTNYRIKYDNDFFALKLGKILTSNIVVCDTIITKLVEIFGRTNLVPDATVSKPSTVDLAEPVNELTT